MVRKIQSRIKVKENLISWIHHQEYIYWSITTYDHACHSPRLRQKNNIEGIIKRKRNFMEKETLSILISIPQLGAIYASRRYEGISFLRFIETYTIMFWINTTVPSFELAIIMEKKSYKNKLIILWHLIQIKILLDTNENFQSFQQNLGSFQIIFYFSYSISEKKLKKCFLNSFFF